MTSQGDTPPRFSEQRRIVNTVCPVNVKSKSVTDPRAFDLEWVGLACATVGWQVAGLSTAFVDSGPLCSLPVCIFFPPPSRLLIFFFNPYIHFPV